MANSNTEHSTELRKKTTAEWKEKNKARSSLNNAFSRGRFAVKNSEVRDLKRLKEFRDLIDEKIKELEEK